MKFKREEDRGATQESVQTGSIADDKKEELERNGTVTEGETVYIDMDKLRPNSNNMYSMSQIEKLGDLIKLSGGILQNIIVLPADEEGVYTITTGERRWRAARLLRDKRLYPEKFEGKVPCTIRGLDDIDLPIGKEMKERFAILTTNQYRDKTDGEKMMEMQEWKKIIEALRSAGAEYLPMHLTDGEQVKIKGTPTRDLLAGQLGVSTGQIARMETVEKKGSPQLLNMLMKDTLDLSAAEEMLRLNEQEQNKTLRQLKRKQQDSEKITKAEVKAQVEKRLEKKQLDRNTVHVELENITNHMSDMITLTDSEYKNYTKLIDKLKKILN